MTTYVYGAFDTEGVLRYIGKSNDVQKRMNNAGGRLANNGYKLDYLMIIDKYVDRETEIINEYLKKGYNLLNKEIVIDNKDKYSIGDKLFYNPLWNDKVIQ